MVTLRGLCCVVTIAVTLCSRVLLADEGMFPLSELVRLNLSEHGLEIAPDKIFNPEGISLVNGICKVNGCTGSFVSSQGLIITNHHCAFDAIQNASTSDRDLLNDGFVAPTMKDEIPAPGYTVRITESYQNVSGDVLSVVTPEMDYLARTKAIERRRKELEQAAEKTNPGLRAEVAEMFTGKTYVLFLYTYLKDVRLVFAPPASIGNFGGENDNWEWPRHTGDFSFMRAYTSPSGTSAEYSLENIPYQPKRVVRVESQGVQEEDFVFILGYPGRTVRHKTASFLKFEQLVRLPAVVDLYAWQIREMDAAGANDRAVAIKHSARTKSLANVEKRSRGQILGLNRTDIVSSKQESETKLQEFIQSDPALREKYGQVLSEIDSVYSEMTAAGPHEFHLRELKSACRAVAFAFSIYEASVERAKPDLDRETPYMDRNWDQTRQQLLLDIKDWHPPTDAIILTGMLDRIRTVPTLAGLPPLQAILESANLVGKDNFVSDLQRRSRVGDLEFAKACLEMDAESLEKSGDSFLSLAADLYPEYVKLRDLDKSREGRLSELYGLLIDVKQAYFASQFVPDANSTLRITYGRIRGYSPSDAVHKSPITTLRGVIEKTTGQEPFITPSAVLKAYERKDFGRFVDRKSGQVPVAILYNTDTTGGNSGSPVLNARGDLVGVNFDRAFEATINDFAWNEAYSRSIGVDIRYVLWITGTVYSGGHLLEEMGIPAN